MRIFTVIALSTVAAIAVVQLAAATPGTGILAAPVLARATLGGDIKLQVKAGDGAGLRWGSREWRPSELPEFLAMLRDQGKVADIGSWIALHPGAAGKLGLPATRTIASPDVAVQQVTIAPGGATGWHTHPGPAFVLVKSGDFTLYEADEAACKGATYKAGQSFVDEGFGNVHIGRNEGTTNVELYVVYVAPTPAGQPVRIDAPKPARTACSF